MYSYVITESFNLIIFHQTLNLLYREDTLTTYLLCLSPNIICYRSLDIWTLDKNLKFTFDFEQNNSLSFLDVKITRGSRGFSSSVFRKTTFSGIFTNFDSFIFESYKTSLIFALLFRCFTICSDAQSFHLEVDHLRQIFECTNCSFILIDHCAKTFLNKIFVPKRTLITVP